MNINKKLLTINIMFIIIILALLIPLLGCEAQSNNNHNSMIKYENYYNYAKIRDIDELIHVSEYYFDGISSREYVAYIKSTDGTIYRTESSNVVFMNVPE